MRPQAIQYLRRYYDLVFPEELEEDEYICFLITETDEKGNILVREDGSTKCHEEFVHNFDEYCAVIDRNRFKAHIFNVISTVKRDEKGELHAITKNMYRRRVLFLDFDKKDFPDLQSAYDVTELLQSKCPGFFVHAMYNSSHGYHCYISVNTTKQVSLLQSLNNEIAILVGADLRSCLPTQQARVPCTFNRKKVDESGDFPLVIEVLHYQNNPTFKENYRPYNFSQIKSRIKNAKKLQTQRMDATSPVGLRVPSAQKQNYSSGAFCTEQVLSQGADKGERNLFLGRIIWMLLGKGLSESEIHEICFDWNGRCRPPKSKAELEEEIAVYLKKKDTYKLGGCWTTIKDERLRNIVKKYCDEKSCSRAFKDDSESYECGLRIMAPLKLVSKKRLRNGSEISMSGQEFLIMAVLYKEMPPGTRKSFTVEDLKEDLQYQTDDGSWKLCMDQQTFKKSLYKLKDLNCIELREPEPEYDNVKPAFSETIIKIVPKMKIKGEKYFEFTYNAIGAMILGNITPQEFKVFLCLANNIEQKQSCTLDSLSHALGMEDSNVSKAIADLEQAHCIKKVRHRNEAGKEYNIYFQVYTDEYDPSPVSE